MKRFYGMVVFAFAFACAVWVTTAGASAQATRTWVSGVGDDANPCSRTAPCKTFAGAISKTSAGGEIDALDPAGFGELTITKAITIDGGGGQVASVLVAGTPGLTISAGPADTVTLRNISFQGLAPGNSSSGTIGINFVSGLVLNVEHCFIQNFSQYGIQFEPSVRAWLNVTDSTFDFNTLGGLVSSTSASTGGVNRVSVVGSSFLSNAGFGVEAGQNTSMTLEGGLIGGNFLGGAISTGVGASLTIDNSSIANNAPFGIHATSSGIVRMSSTSVSLNHGSGLLSDGGGQILSWGNNHVAGNQPDGSPTGTLSNI